MQGILLLAGNATQCRVLADMQRVRCRQCECMAERQRAKRRARTFGLTHILPLGWRGRLDKNCTRSSAFVERRQTLNLFTGNKGVLVRTEKEEKTSGINVVPYYIYARIMSKFSARSPFKPRGTRGGKRVVVVLELTDVTASIGRRT